MIYLLDANVLIEAKNRYYSFDVCPGFWDWLQRENTSGNVLSIEAVATELVDPDAAKWVRDNRGFFVPSDDSMVSGIAAWIQNQTRFKEAERTKFLRGADARLISHAALNGATVVTKETAEPQSSRVKIPDVCRAFNVECIDTFKALHQLNAKFVLA
ncbi:MAG: DUF4411 family protein [Candidatus Kapabacteria bacterium]|nr:DUF4411 family protein [Ignavibacteria bacterium]MBK6418909.1 DUF4411 family protein [Ignavibacteria bacterium]MBK7411815.1 DUF4411 family protein [Ignavibacteria bacterium]MBP6509610.1 DUF4411 family protein [Candidatus Kapabacteria bacterium]MBP7093464.1 DUF4411 family protein [Candidatus Kapabacteria bacterium]